MRTLLVLAAGALAFGLATAVGLAWPLAGAFAMASVVVLSVGSLSDHHEVVAVRADEDFGRIALLDDGRWEGAAPLAGLPRPIDVEIEATGDAGPTLAQRIAYQDACAQFLDLVPSLAAACDHDEATFEASAQYLCLRLPAAEEPDAPDWSLCFTTAEDRDARAGRRR